MGSAGPACPLKVKACAGAEVVGGKNSASSIMLSSSVVIAYWEVSRASAAATHLVLAEAGKLVAIEDV